MQNGRYSRAGFTLIELLVVMVIVASLLAIAVPRYFRSLDHSRDVVLMQDLAVLRDSIDQFYADRGRYPETLGELAEERYIRKVPVDPVTKSSDTWVLSTRIDEDGVEGVFDVHSGAEGLSSKGISYEEF